MLNSSIANQMNKLWSMDLNGTSNDTNVNANCNNSGVFWAI